MQVAQSVTVELACKVALLGFVQNQFAGIYILDITSVAVYLFDTDTICIIKIACGLSIVVCTQKRIRFSGYI